MDSPGIPTLHSVPFSRIFPLIPWQLNLFGSFFYSSSPQQLRQLPVSFQELLCGCEPDFPFPKLCQLFPGML